MFDSRDTNSYVYRWANGLLPSGTLHRLTRLLHSRRVSAPVRRASVLPATVMLEGVLMPRTSAARRPRGSLSPEAIVSAATRFVEERGLSELSMSALGREMGLPPSSLHWHFRTRQELIDQVAQEVTLQLFDAMPAPDGDGPWDQQLTTWFTELRVQHLARPRLFDLPTDRALLLTNPPVERRIRLQIDHVISMLTEAGLSREDAYATYHLCGVFVRGFVRVEIADAEHNDTLYGGTYDRDGEGDVELLAPRRATRDRQFQLGLSVLLAGIRATMIDVPDGDRAGS